MIPCRCQSCRQEMSVPDSLAGHFESCPACKAIVAVPGPNDSSWPHGESSSSPAAIRQGGPPAREPGFGIERILEFVGVLIAAIGMAGIVLGVALLLLTGREDAASACGTIAGGFISFPAGLALAALGSVVVELKRIRMLLQESGRNRPQ